MLTGIISETNSAWLGYSCTFTISSNVSAMSPKLRLLVLLVLMLS